MRRIYLFAFLSCALVMTTADFASAGGCGHSRCHSKCHSKCHTRCHSRCHSCCYTSCCATTCGAASTCSTCFGGVCLVDGSVAMPAAIVVQLPADAVLTIDGQATNATSDVRVFNTPDLATGQTYTYTLQARMANGEVMTQQVNFRAGEQTTVRFDMPGQAVAQR